MSRKLESLPADLRAAADELLAKKFNPKPEISFTIDASQFNYQIVQLSNAFATTWEATQDLSVATTEFASLLV